MISNCGHDENGKYHSGKAGDQTGGEWTVRTWYSRPWTSVLRHPDKEVREKIAEYARSAADNNNVGYDQWERMTFWAQLQKSDYDPRKITTKCEADCSSGVGSIVKAVGYTLNIKKLKDVPANITTRDEEAKLKAAGFEVLTAKKYLSSDKYLLPGDILLYNSKDSGHTAINLNEGSATKTDAQKNQNGKTIDQIVDEVIAGLWGNGTARKSKLESAGYNYQEVQDAVNAKLKAAKASTSYKVVNVKSYLNVRTGPGTSYKSVGQLKNGTRIEVKKLENGWAQLDNGNWVSSNYIAKV